MQGVTTLLILPLLIGCGEEGTAADGGERRAVAECQWFRPIYSAFWAGYESLPKVKDIWYPPDNRNFTYENEAGREFIAEYAKAFGMTPEEVENSWKEEGRWPEPDPDAPPPEPVEILTTQFEREAAGVSNADRMVVEAWPLIEDETLRYVVREMAEAEKHGDWIRNFVSASSYCGLK